jgi:DNA-binding NtrC family response regulator
MAGSKILILEDDASLAAVLGTVLRQMGNQVTVCTEFEDARTRLTDEPPDAVLTDVRVGAYNGLHLALLFRSMSPEGKVIVISGHDDPVIRKEAERMNAEFLLKPVGVFELESRFGNLPYSSMFAGMDAGRRTASGWRRHR